MQSLPSIDTASGTTASGTTASGLSAASQSYLDARMDAVSRSFAVVVAVLDQPLRAQLATAYLLCRVADNIEDCTEPADWKTGRFAEFARLLADPGLAPDILPAWDAAPWPGLTRDERAMMGHDGADLWRIYAGIPVAERQIIARWVWAMTEGMAHLGETGHEPTFVQVGGVQVLARPADYDHYCYIVAGTVGHLATDLALHRYGVNGAVGDRLTEASEACGRALQKTNILKDFTEDLARGVAYLPASWLGLADYAPLALGGASGALTQMVFDDLLADLEVATQYVLDLPLVAADYRQACLLCLLPALQTNLLAAESADRLFTAGHTYKISRITLGQCMLQARRMVGDNAGIQAYSRDLQARIRAQIAGAQ